MRTGLSTIQQTLMPEAAAVLDRSIAEAARRNHGQTTPLHVAATLLASPTGFLRQACIRSHPNSSHPLQCRALELCFSVALDRLPSTGNSNASSSGGGGIVREPPLSNALMAALKRAQAHQRRGCPEQQQQPLLALKVELEQLVVSILDDPSVSRVMREASFSSPAVKATIEQSMTTTTNSSSSAAAASSTPTVASNSPSLALSSSSAVRLGLLGLRPLPTTMIPGNRNLYLNPLLQHQQKRMAESGGVGAAPLPAALREEEVKKVLEILQKPKKRNPVLVGDSEPDALLKEVLQRIERKEGVDGALRNLQVISLEKEFASDRSQVTQKLKELGDSLETRLELFRRDSGGGGVILNLGDLKWLVESPNGLVQSSGSINIQLQQLVSEIGRAAVVEMRDLVGRFDEGGGGSGRLWLIGTASCATYLRCQVYHPSMENDWDLQAVPIAPRAPLPSLFPRTAGNGGILSSSVESLAPARGFSPMTATTSPLRRPPDKIDPSRKPMCPSCSESYEEELAKLVETKFQRTNSSSSSIPDQRQPPLPPWLQDAKLGNGATKQDQTREQEQKWKGSTEDLLKKWTETCSSLHSNPNLILQHPFELKPLPLPATQTCSPLRLSNHCGLRPLPALPEQPISPPRSPIRTDLALGRPKASDEQNHRDRITNSGGCVQDFFARQHTRETTGNGNLDAGSFKQLFKGLSETASWQPEAASAIAFTVMQCKSGNGKQRTTGAKRDTWLMFVGPDKVGKKKMAAALSDLVFGPGGGPVIISLSGSSRLDSEDMESNVRFRGKMALDRVAEAVQRDPFAVFVLEDIDQADMLVQGSIMRAMEKGRLPDSHGREVSLGSAIFIMTSNSLPENLRTSDMDSLIQCEEKLEAAMTACWQLELLIEEKTAKRQPEWLCEDDRQTKPRKEHKGGISLDLNLATGMLDEETGDSSRNSSDVTVEHEHRHDYGQLAFKGHSTSMPMELINAVDDTIVFKPVDFGPVRRKVSDALSWKFSSVVGSGWTVQVDEEALDRIVGGIWFSGGADDGFEEWMERVMVPCFCQLKSIKVASVDKLVVKLVTVKDQFPPTSIDGLPSQITITGGGGWPMRAV